MARVAKGTPADVRPALGLQPCSTGFGGWSNKPQSARGRSTRQTPTRVPWKRCNSRCLEGARPGTIGRSGNCRTERPHTSKTKSVQPAVPPAAALGGKSLTNAAACKPGVVGGVGGG